MSQASVYGPALTLTPGPALVITRGSDGLVSASMDFSCRKFEIGNTTILNQLRKGTRITTLYPDIGSQWDFLFLDKWENRDESGGLTTITVDFIGTTQTDFGFGDDSSVTYTRNNATTEKSIFENPNFLKDVAEDSTREAIRLGSQALAKRDVAASSDSYYIIDTNGSDRIIEEITDSEAMDWWDFIVSKANLTYLAATSEWTKSATGKGKLRDSEFVNFGYIETEVPGSPGTPPGQAWLFTGATESITVSGDGANSYSLTYTLGIWPEFVYKKRAES